MFHLCGGWSSEHYEASSRSTHLKVQRYSEFHDDRRMNFELDTNLLVHIIEEVEEMNVDSIYNRRTLAFEGTESTSALGYITR